MILVVAAADCMEDSSVLLVDDHTSFRAADCRRSVVENYTCSWLAHWQVLPLF